MDTVSAVELVARSDEMASSASHQGKAQTVEWETARAEVLKELARRRAGRTSP
jgi:hypothetical protein